VFLAAAMAAGGASAQQLPAPGGASPQELTLPPLDGSESPLMSPQASDELPPELAPPMAPIGSGVYGGHHELGTSDYQLWDHSAAPIESTGTWLRRGFWYAEADAVVWNRTWNRDNKWFAADDVDVESPTFFFNTVGLLSTNRILVLDGSQPGEDSSVRVTLGHFLFRDQRNRDHTAEFTVFGGGDWEQDRVITSRNNFGLFVPFAIDGGNPSFDGATRQTLAYSSHYSSFELNYRVKQRMSRDQLVMDPDGSWHRAASPGATYDYLVGLRMMEMRDILDWQAEDVFALGSDATYLLRTDNDLFGFQMGTGISLEHSRWSLGAKAKGGVFVNDALGRSTLDFTDEDDNNDDFDLRLTNDELSFIGEFHLIGKWHLTPSFSLRAGYELMYLTSVALAPNQANFIPEFATLSTTGDPFYHGASFGFEGYW
jgi:hypothetical protein